MSTHQKRRLERLERRSDGEIPPNAQIVYLRTGQTADAWRAEQTEPQHPRRPVIFVTIPTEKRNDLKPFATHH